MITNRMELEQSMLSDGALQRIIDSDEYSCIEAMLARELLAYRKAISEPVADVVAWNKPGEERKCDIRWRRFDVSPGPLFEAPPLQAVPAPDGWINCSEHTPEEGGRYWCYVEEQNSLGKSHYQWNCSWNGDKWSDAALSGRVTHWMPLAAAPQPQSEVDETTKPVKRT